jgi:hypothetical protein
LHVFPHMRKVDLEVKCTYKYVYEHIYIVRERTRLC